MPTLTPTRDWKSTGTGHSAARREDIGAEIDRLTWQEPVGSVPFSPGMALKKLITEFELPKVSAIAYNGMLRYPDGPEMATYTLLGVEANYANGRVRVYVLDTGTTLIPLAADHWPLCQWFAACTNEATATEDHPTLGNVPICDRCAAKLQVIRPATAS